MSEILLIAGLGNPGSEYAKTRHNAGFMFLDKISQKTSASFKPWQKLGEYAKVSVGGKDIFLARPLTFMNLSGDMLGSLARFYKIPPQSVLVCYDDMSLNLGEVRIRPEGSAGGQKGMLSTINNFGTQEIPRLKIGTGPKPEFIDAVNFVLGKFTKEEQKTLNAALDKAVEAALCAVGEGLERAMNKFN